MLSGAQPEKKFFGHQVKNIVHELPLTKEDFYNPAWKKARGGFFVLGSEAWAIYKG